MHHGAEDAVAGRITPAAGRYGGRSAEERQAERRRRFLEAGLDLFGGGPGYRATRITDVCRAAGLSSRQFYEEFHTLEDLLAELHLYVNDVAQRSVLAVLPQVRHLEPIDRCTRLFRAYAAGATADPRHTRIAFVEIIGVSPRLDRQRLDRRARWIDFLCEQLDDAAGRGEIPPARLPHHSRRVHRGDQRAHARLGRRLGRRHPRPDRGRAPADAPGQAPGPR
ncbi:TetR/AcrR family transcriptional regulator [Microbispora sp. GKU 823]|uniref:TetR/AcrR family transcriptional regulator n=1 Tax=Microbispora sp. GKU 823 TaxID=1652100 RepID=UPI001C4DFCAD|nr:TetR/AcrR family transcriptional regulator [Microbispora sp. GKU 823]